MALQILNQGPLPETVVAQMREAIAAAIAGSEIEINPTSPGHFEITVISEIFDGKSRVAQHQLVYGAITDLMSGPQAPVHAVDRLDCRTP